MSIDPYCSSCHELLSGDRHEHFYNRPLCDDCLYDANETLEDCEICGNVIAGGNPFSRYCDTHLEKEVNS